MPTILEPAPKEVADDLAQLRAALDKEIPPKALDRNLLIATWNICHFGDLTEKWQSGPGDKVQRDLACLLSITEVVKRFDVIAIQEVGGNLKALRHMLKLLGADWAFTLTDVTRGTAGNQERLAFLFDTRKVQLSGLACELVIPEEWMGTIKTGALTRQFARTPYAVSFRSGGQTFILVTLHVIYGESEERVPELKAIAQWLADWADEINEWGHNLVALGDFNIDRQGDKLYEAFVSTGLVTPEQLNSAPRTIFASSSNEKSFYDQIAWFAKKDGLPALSLGFVNGGSFDFVKTALASRKLTTKQLPSRISDHYPLWAEFSVTG